PGLVASDIWRRVPGPVRSLIKMRMLSAKQGARTSVYCATSPAVAAVSGRYYDDCAERQPSPVATEELGRLLWEQSEAWTKPSFLAPWPHRRSPGRQLWRRSARPGA